MEPSAIDMNLISYFLPDICRACADSKKAWFNVLWIMYSIQSCLLYDCVIGQ